MSSDASISAGPSAEVTTRVLNVNDTLLNCSVCNFYPEAIDANWKKDGEIRDYETCRGDIIRNWDGTYCTWISIEINPMEQDRYCCYVEHDGLREPLCVKGDKLQGRGELWVMNFCLAVPIGDPILVLFY